MKYAKAFDLLGGEVRAAIIRVLLESPAWTVCNRELTERVSKLLEWDVHQSTISNHFQLLLISGAVSSKKQGKSRVYAANVAWLEELEECLLELLELAWSNYEEKES